MLFPWSRAARRQELLATPFPAEWRGYLRSNVAHYPLLTPKEQARLEDDLRVFLAEKHWEGCGGLTLTDEMRVTVSAQACLLILGLSLDYYDSVESILIYPDTYVATTRAVDAGWIVTERPMARAGQASSWGTVVLSWAGVVASGRAIGEPYNVVLHEFAHVLDFQNGSSDGVPRLDDALLDRWSRVMSDEYQTLRREQELGLPTPLRSYAATDPSEFFAVATECFFQQPRVIAVMKPDLYDVLRGFYRQDPAARVPS